MKIEGIIYCIVLTLITLLCGCSSKTPKADNQTVKLDSVLDTKHKEYTIDLDSIKNGPESYSLYLTNKYKVAESDLLAPYMIVYNETEGKISIATEGEIIYKPFLSGYEINLLQSAYDNIFEVEKNEIDDKGMMREEPFYYKLAYKDSYINIHHLKYKGWDCDQYHEIDDYNIVSAVIANREIRMNNGIYIGMTKEDFFLEKLGLEIPCTVDTLYTGCETGDIEQLYIFEANKLHKVLITTSYDFADIQFH